ncbi:MAG: hypothetical protein RSB51_03160 [Clostridia bacterium]
MKKNNLKELEVKLLDVNLNKIKEKLKSINAKYKCENMQQLYVYDLPNVNTTYYNIINEINSTDNEEKLKILLKKLKSIIFDIVNLVTDEELKIIEPLCNQIDKCIKIDAEIKRELNNEKYIKVISAYTVNPNKWIRLRKTGEKVELTIKHILKRKKLGYDIDKINEYEIKVDNLEVANLILEQFSIVPRGYQEKYRISYEYDEMQIEIDKWPKIPAYVEIEGKNVEKIYNLAKLLGYEKENVKIMNTAEVYNLNNLNIYDFPELKFEKSEIEKYKESNNNI